MSQADSPFFTNFDELKHNLEGEDTYNIESDFKALDSSNEWFDPEYEGQLNIDIYQDNNNLYVISTIAGVEPEDLEIGLQGDLLTIRGKREKNKFIETNDSLHSECYWGGFSRSVILPTEVKADNIKASLKNGLLLITLPKVNRDDFHEIKITK